MSKIFEYAGGYNARFTTGGIKGNWGEYVVLGGQNGVVRGEKLVFHGMAEGACVGEHKWLVVDAICAAMYFCALVGAGFGVNVGQMSLLVCGFRLLFALVVLNRWKYGYAVAYAAIALYVYGDLTIAEQELLLCSGACLVWLVSRLVFITVRWLIPNKVHWANAACVVAMLFRVAVTGGRAFRAAGSFTLVAAIACDLAVIWYMLCRIECFHIADTTMFLLLMAAFVPVKAMGLTVFVMIYEMVSAKEIMSFVRRWYLVRSQVSAAVIKAESNEIKTRRSPFFGGEDGGDKVVRMLLEGKYGGTLYVSLEEWDTIGTEAGGMPSSELVRSYALSGDKIMSYALEMHCFKMGMRPSEVNAMKQLVLSNSAMARFFNERLLDLFEGVAHRSDHRKATVVEALVGVLVAEFQLWYDVRVFDIVSEIARENMLIGEYTKMNDARMIEQIDLSLTVHKVCMMVEAVGKNPVSDKFIARFSQRNVNFDRRQIKALARVGRAALEASWTCEQVVDCKSVKQITVAIATWFVDAHVSDPYYYVMRNAKEPNCDVGCKAAAENFMACIGILAVENEMFLVYAMRVWFIRDFIVDGVDWE